MVRFRDDLLLLGVALAGFGSVQGRPSIESAYLGLTDIPIWGVPVFSSVTGFRQNPGDDGMPIVLSVQVDGASLDATDFRVVSEAGVESVPNNATLRPALGEDELHTVLLSGPISEAGDPPARVEIVGSLLDVDGNELSGLVSQQVTIGAVAGPSLVFAYQLLNPDESRGNIQLAWQGGVTGPNNADVGDGERQAIRIIDADGVEHISPSLDDVGDGDNYLELELPQGVIPHRVEIPAGIFYDPLNVPNPATAVNVTSLLPSAAALSLVLDVPVSGMNRIEFKGTPARVYRVLFSHDLTQWDCLGARTADASSGLFSMDHGRDAQPRGFYRAEP
jgi:hypothetical protein